VPLCSGSNSSRRPWRWRCYSCLPCHTLNPGSYCLCGCWEEPSLQSSF